MPQPDVKPNLIAIVVCDNIYMEPTGKVALVGLFTQIVTTQCPFIHPRMAIYVSISGLRPGSQGKLDIVHGETENVPLAAAQGRFPEKAGPLDVLDMQFILMNVAFQVPGKHFIRFWGNDYLIGKRPFYVVKKERTESQEPRLEEKGT
jgi:hypothetical protein